MAYRTEEDINRVRSQLVTQKIEKTISNLSNTEINDYMNSLEMIGNISFATPDDITRCHQLINKTNQFNNLKKSLTKNEVLKAQENECLLVTTLEDKFTKYGVVSVLIIDKEKELEIKHWVMSCEVFNRNFEKFICAGAYWI